MVTPKIYVACLASYNNGILHGRWIDADQCVDAIYDEIKKILSESTEEYAEEWAIHDYEGFGSISISEYQSIEEIVSFTEFGSEHGELGLELIAEFGLDDARIMMDEHYHGAYDSEVDYAWYVLEEFYADSIPKNLLFYFDCELFARDLFINDYYSVEADGKTHVFTRY